MTEQTGQYVRPKDIDNRATFQQRMVWRLESIAWDVIYWWPMKMLGPDRASNFGGWLVKKIGPLFSQHKTTVRNLKLAFPDWTDEQIAATARLAWENVGRTAGELPHLPSIDPYTSGRVDVIGEEHLENLRESGSGAVMVSGHLANWEIMAAVICKRVPSAVVTYRALNNPHIDKRINRVRTDYGINATAPKGIGTRELMRALKAGRPVCLMNDQKFREGISVSFFGHDAMTAPGPTRLALKYRVPIIPVSTIRTGPARFQVTIHEPFFPQDTGNLDADIKTSVERITRFVEDRIREHPGQWFWQHRRWPKEAWQEAGLY